MFVFLFFVQGHTYRLLVTPAEIIVKSRESFAHTWCCQTLSYMVLSYYIIYHTLCVHGSVPERKSNGWFETYVPASHV